MSTKEIYKLSSEVIVYPGMSGWRFLVLSKKVSEEIKSKYGKKAKSWGSLPVSVTVGKTSWNTSIFPDKKHGTYLLPLKAEIRKAEGIEDNAKVKYSIKLM